LFLYIAAYWRGWLLLGAMTITSIPFALLQPWPMQVLVDHVLNGKPFTSSALAHLIAVLPGAGSAHGLLAWVVAAGLLVFVFNSLLDLILTFGWINVGQRMVYDLARDLFAVIQRRSMVFHTRNFVGDLMSRIVSDSWCINTMADNLLLKPVHVLFTLVSMAVVMAAMDLQMTLLSFAVVPFMAGSSFLMGRPVRAAARASREIAAQMQSHVQQTLSGMPVVQAFAQEERAQELFLRFAGSRIRAEQRNTVVSSIYALGSGLIITLGNAAILWIGAHHVLVGQLSLGRLLVFLSYLTSLYGQMRVITEIYRTLQQTAASADRVMEMLDPEQDVKERSDAIRLRTIKGRVVLEDVTFGYEPGRPSVQKVCLEARPGETLAVVGPTGAGKTTLISLVPRLVDPWEGRVLVDGHDIRDVELKSLRSQVALVLQEAFLLPLSIADNIALGRPAASRGEIEAAARAANAHEFILLLPEGYDTVIGERGATFSGGERQRLSIARALLKDAPILILDEPTSALDAGTEELLMQALQRLMKGRTTFIVAHRLSTIRNASRIVVLEGGKVVETGSHEELLRRGGVFAYLHDMQFGGGRDG
jgi:ATP-binding cassette subfamily B protein/subfamily B ATP-binding cassette protein MsbA